MHSLLLACPNEEKVRIFQMPVCLDTRECKRSFGKEIKNITNHEEDSRGSCSYF